MMRLRLPPGPAAPFLGLGLARRLRNEPLALATELASRFGELATFPLGPYRAVVVNHPALVREVLVTKAKCFRKLPRVMRALSQLDGNGLPVNQGASWLGQRRLLQRAFSARRLGHFGEVTVATTRRWLAGRTPETAFDVTGAMMGLTLAILLRALFGVELPPDRAAIVCEAVGDLSELLVREMGQPLGLPDWLPGDARRRKRRALGVMGGLFRELLRRRPGAGRPKGPLAFLLSEAGVGPQTQARDEVLALLHAGHETMAAGLAWTCYLLAAHPDVQENVAQEVDAQQAWPAAAEDLPRLCRVGRVVKESLRLYTPTWTLFPRQAIREADVGGYSVPRGSWVFIFPYALHRDPRWFDRPEEFDPERFAPGRVERIVPGAYIPFGAGSHLCLGARFAPTAMTLIVATILREFRLALAAGEGAPEPEPFLALRPKGNLRLKLTRRP
jgi:cytochrome P450